MGLLIAALIIGLIRAYEAHRTSTRFFSNRSELLSTGLHAELLSSGEVWAVWPSGYIVPNLARDALGRIKRLLVGDPYGPVAEIKAYADDYLVGSVEHVKEVILEVTRTAQKADVPVKWHGRRNLSIVIGEPYSRSNKGWARIEFLMPFVPSSNRCSVTITQATHPDVFSSVVNSFDRLWATAKEPNLPSVPSDFLEVKAARYGFGTDPARWRNVTEEVNAAKNGSR